LARVERPTVAFQKIFLRGATTRSARKNKRRRIWNRGAARGAAIARGERDCCAHLREGGASRDEKKTRVAQHSVTRVLSAKWPKNMGFFCKCAMWRAARGETLVFVEWSRHRLLGNRGSAAAGRERNLRQRRARHRLAK